ncbi:MAG: hypothetical protein KGH69_03270 [Candidatus Micrarchaeota archaeon]|nr:hypothetical protein [Candidatus Micrarchaeota archaeon]
MTIQTKVQGAKYHVSESKDWGKRRLFTSKFIASQEDRKRKITGMVEKDLGDFKRGARALARNSRMSGMYGSSPEIQALPKTIEGILEATNMNIGPATNTELVNDIAGILEGRGKQIEAAIRSNPREAMQKMLDIYVRTLNELDESYGELKPFFSAVRTSSSLISKQAAVRFHRGPKSMFIEADEKRLAKLAAEINADPDKIEGHIRNLKIAEAQLSMVTEIRNAMKEGNYAKASEIALNYPATYTEGAMADDIYGPEGREATTVAGLRHLSDEIDNDIKALLAFKASKGKGKPKVTNEDVNIKMQKLFIIGHAMIDTLDEELKSASEKEMKDHLEGLKEEVLGELDAANKSVKAAWETLGRGKSIDFSSIKETNPEIIRSVSDFLRAEDAREAHLRDDIENKLRALSKTMGIPAIRLEDAVERAMMDMTRIKQGLRDRNVFDEAKFMDTLPDSS